MSWSEILIVAVVALIVVGPKDLPGMFRELGKFTAKAKRMARDFSRAMEDAADGAGVADVQKTFQAAVNPAKAAADSASKAVKDAVDFDAFDDDTETGKLAQKRKAETEAARARVEAVKAANAAAAAQGQAFAKAAEEPAAPEADETAAPAAAPEPETPPKKASDA
ncbi:sec-independent protein translocase protein TatB [Litoreibacter ponti]|uniref:Sec-independent protein translocase protein TatB n=1 Tax=Litoreibacter ponti TaxID=1510457 RepID=A0A2T6BKC4_9RHOB|nr:Sec-independent protein translocase protein TatB [Litoreibacter ponti]PTX56496.1 sec-independent protein translocase protein TatB [Litoreibacter ponti]